MAAGELGVAPAAELVVDVAGDLVLAPAAEPPEPLPLRDDDERFAGFVERDVEGWPLRRGRLSASAFAKFMMCPEQFRRSYIEGEWTTTQGRMLAGTAAHGAVEATIRHALAGNGLATPAQIEATHDAVFEAAFAQAAGKGGVEWGQAEKRDLDFDKALGIGRRAVAAYSRDVLPGVLEAGVLDVEHTFVVEAPGCPVPIVGLIDVATPASSIDLKFGDQCVRQVRPDWRVQGIVYGLARRLPVDFHPASWAGKTATPRTEPGLRYAWSAADVVIAGRLIAATTQAILLYAERFGLDGPWPGNLTHTWACGSCDFKPECAWWNLTPGDLLT